MELFSELYGAYYRLVNQILSLAQTPVTKEQIQKLIQSQGFGESGVQLAPKLFGRWPLLRQTPDGLWQSRVRPPRVPLSTLELRWLRAVLCDSRAPLFLTDRLLERLEALTAQLQPLYRQQDFFCYDQYSDGDPFQNPDYRRRFGQLLEAIRYRQLVEIRFRAGVHGNGKSAIHQGVFLPLRLEYSQKDNKFRAQCARAEEKKLSCAASINLGRILNVSPPLTRYEGCIDTERLLRKNRSRQPVEILVTPERNALERFMVEFSPYEKESVLQEETGCALVKLWYPAADEAEILIKLLGFGPVIQILGPERMLRQIRSRVCRQRRILHDPRSL